MLISVRVKRLWCPISDERDGWRGYYWISPERQRKKWLRWVVQHPIRREEETSVMWVAHKLSLHERSSHQLPILPVGGQGSVGHNICVLFNSAVMGKDADQQLCFGVLALSFTSVWKAILKQFCQILLHRLLTETSTQSCAELWLVSEADRGALHPLIPGQSQINRVSVSMAVWPLSHFKSGPFRLFDLTSISYVIGSPRHLFLSPISDSVSTFSANSLDNTRQSALALLFGSHPPPFTPPLLSRLRLVSDPCLFLPLWLLMVYLVSNLIFFLSSGWLRRAISPVCCIFLHACLIIKHLYLYTAQSVYHSLN